MADVAKKRNISVVLPPPPWTKMYLLSLAPPLINGHWVPHLGHAIIQKAVLRYQIVISSVSGTDLAMFEAVTGAPREILTLEELIGLSRREIRHCVELFPYSNLEAFSGHATLDIICEDLMSLVTPNPYVDVDSFIPQISVNYALALALLHCLQNLFLCW